jgi:hypothetical protein
MGKSGIYFLFNKKQLVYIGKTTNYPARVKTHRDKDFDSMRFIECDEARLDYCERRLIYYFKPPLNVKNKNSLGESGIIRLPKAFYDELYELSEREHRSVHRQVEWMLCQYLEMDKAVKSMTKV